MSASSLLLSRFRQSKSIYILREDMDADETALGSLGNHLEWSGREPLLCPRPECKPRQIPFENAEKLKLMPQAVTDIISYHKIFYFLFFKN